MTVILILITNSNLHHVKYNPSWAQTYPVKSVTNDLYSFYCAPCRKSVRCDHQGLRDVIVHCASLIKEM